MGSSVLFVVVEGGLNPTSPRHSKRQLGTYWKWLKWLRSLVGDDWVVAFVIDAIVVVIEVV